MDDLPEMRHILGTMNQPNLDRTDRLILRHLQTDSRVSNAELAKRVGVSASVCWRRVRALEEAGVITAYRAEVQPVRAGLGFHAVVHVKLTRHNPDHLKEFIDAVSRRAEVIDCYATTGPADYHIRVLCRDIEAYNTFLERFLFRLAAVESAQTNVVLREIKRAGAIPL